MEDTERSGPARTGTSALSFVALTYVYSWVLWTPVIVWLESRDRWGGVAGEEALAGIPVWVGLLWFLGSWGPTVVGIALTRRAGGPGAVRALLGRALDWRVGGRWHAAAWGGPSFLALLAIGLFVLTGGGPVRFSVERMLLIPVALLLAFPFGPLGEEFGWRGYLLPRLQRTRSALGSAVFVGLAWTFWHLPVFWAPAGTSISGTPVTLSAVGQFTLEVTAMSVLMTWLFNNTRGSLLIAIAAHAAWNAGMERFLFDPFDDPTQMALLWWSVALMAVACVAVVWFFGPRRLTRGPRPTRSTAPPETSGGDAKAG